MGIGIVLRDKGFITDEQLADAVGEQDRTGDRLDRVLLRQGTVSREDMTRTISEQFHMRLVDLDEVYPEDEVLQAIPAAFITRQHCAPIALEGDRLTVATSDPFEIAALDELRLLTGHAIELVLAEEEDLQKYIRTHYGVGSDTLETLGAEVEAKPDEAGSEDFDQAQEASVIKLVNDILVDAINERATDVHVEPYERELIVRFRIDGVLQRANVSSTINRFGNAIVSRIKIMSNLNIAEKRKPQDGRISFRKRINGRVHEFDLRVSVIPMLFGEGVVLRILSKTAALMRLEDLGMDGPILTRWDRLISRPHGITLVTGPTGSGKSTTLYSSLNRIVTDGVKAITVEDPVEYHVTGVNQIQVNTKTGLTFSAGLRSILRHDPDIVMVGEIRDKETAETAIQASLTGHLVFSTLHTNDAAGANTRLIDMGVEPFLVSSSIEGVLAQRLLRKVCAACGAPDRPDNSLLPAGLVLGEGQTLTKGGGCRECRNTGFRGRLGVFELLTLTPELREMIMDRANAPSIAARAVEIGELSTLHEDGLEKLIAGQTSLSEFVRALAV
ncbi:MAG: type II secretory ATPase GspE/PulE/Tfp pilus assembly ATPase PilB-like protein [Phycisphaerales bacterium]|jgi:type II secretory ATPase GspE/PulE/Tfp pilus assembly ATPase PilB-like protein